MRCGPFVERSTPPAPSFARRILCLPSATFRLACMLLLGLSGCAPLCTQSVAPCSALHVKAVPAPQPAPGAKPKALCGPKTPPPAAVPPGAVAVAPPAQMELIRRPTAGVTVTPRELIAPVGSEVVLVAGVCGPDGYLLAGESVQWLMSQGGVGEITSIGEHHGILDGFPQKVDNQYATGRTSRKYLRLTRGTPAPEDDVTVLRGQAWTSVTSPVEGTSHVTAFAPDVKEWDQRKDVSMIHWVDAEWQLPPPSVNPAGSSHTFTTMVSRHTDHSPLQGYLVRYEIISGPAAGFAPGGENMVEVETNSLGQASAELVQRQPLAGVNTIRVDVIRPASTARGYQKRLTLGSGLTSKTWSASQLVVRKSGPSQATLGSAVTYRIDVQNPGNVPLDGVVVQDQIPDPMSFVSALPNAQVQGRTLSWNLGSLAAGATRSFEVNMKVERAGVVNNCATVTAAGGLSAQDCVSTTVLDSQLEIRLRGVSEAVVGDTVTFEVVATNRGSAPVSGLVAIDSFDPGLEHATGANPIKKELGELAAGASKTFGVTFKLTQPGELCQRLELRDSTGAAAQDRFCLRVREAPPAAKGKLTVQKFCPQSRRVGESVEFEILVRNTGDGYLRNVRLLDQYDTTYLDATFASENFNFKDNGSDLEYIFAEPLAPGQEKQLKVVCKCLRSVRQACNKVVATAEGVDPVTAQTCLEIVEAGNAPKVLLRMAELDDPVRLNGVATYIITLVNQGEAPVRDVRLEVVVPPEMRFEGLSPTNPTRHREQAGSLFFEPIVSIDPGRQLRYEVRLRAMRSGTANVTATLTEGTAAQPFANVTERTEIAAGDR